MKKTEKDLPIKPIPETLKVEIDITDWMEKSLQEEKMITSKEDVFNQVDDNEKTGDIAKRLSVSRKLGIAPEDIAPPDKTLYYTGCRTAVSTMISNAKHTYETEKGLKLNARSYIGKPVNLDNAECSEFAKHGSQEALRNAKLYLERTVPGMIFSRLVIIKESGGDVEAAIEDLLGTIGGMGYYL